MKRIILLIGILGFATILAGCDRCGNFGPFFPSSEPKTCGDAKPAG